METGLLQALGALVVMAHLVPTISAAARTQESAGTLPLDERYDSTFALGYRVGFSSEWFPRSPRWFSWNQPRKPRGRQVSRG